MKKLLILAFTVILIVLPSCSNISKEKVENVGLLVEGTIHDQTWGKKGYMGLLKIKEELGVDVFFKEGVTSQLEVNAAVEEFANNGVNLIFGHSSIYGEYFSKINDSYPDITFVYFNGKSYDDNLISINFNAHAMGFFAGMIAAAMSNTDHVGVIGTFSWQTEVDGFYEGAKYQNPDAEVSIQYVNSWDNVDRALEIYDDFNRRNVDVYYPAGDSFHIPVIQKVKQNGQYAIGYISDQIELGENTILTSTVQHVDYLYLAVANLLHDGELKEKLLEFDFQDGVISMGTFSDNVPEYIQNMIADAVKVYIETGKLPNEIE